MNKKTQLAILCSLFFATSMVHAQKKPQSVQSYSCKSETAAGLDWNGNRWTTATFYGKGGFFLTVAKFEDNIEMLLKSDSDEYFCRTGFRIQGFMEVLVPTYSCSNAYGQVIVFSEKNMRGGLASLFGATDADSSKRDSLSVQPFICIAK